MKRNRLSEIKTWALAVALACTTFGSAAEEPAYVLDNLTDAGSKVPTVAYSVRKLTAAYNGPAMRVFRSNDNDTVDVYFDANGVVSMSSPVSASRGGAATANTLQSWVGENCAFVAIWYDQSGNGRNARNKTAIKKMNNYLIADGSAIGVLGNPMEKFDAYTATTSSYSSVVSFNLTNSNTTVAKSKYVVSGKSIPLFTCINQENSGKTNWSFTNPHNGFVKGETLTAYPNTNTLLPYNVLMTDNGKYIGTIASVESNTSLTFTKVVASAVYEPSKWGLCNLPCLVYDGKLQMMNEKMAALRVFSGTNSGSRLVVDTFRNDGGERQMRKVIAFNLMSVVKQEGNFVATNGATYFGTKASVASADRRFCMGLMSTSTMVPTYKIMLGSKISGTANSSYANGIIVTRNTVKADNTGTTRGSMQTTVATIASPALGNGFTPGNVISVKIDTIKVWDATLNDSVKTAKKDTTILYTTVAGVAADALDETQLQLFGYGESERNFEGLGSEFIFYASTKADAQETDMDNLYVDQQLNFTSAPASMVRPAGAITTTGASITLSIYRLGGIPGVAERGLMYGTASDNLSNLLPDTGTPAAGDFTKALTGLTPNTKYYYGGYAASQIKKANTTVLNFTTLSLSPDSVKPATEITAKGFRASWSVVSTAQGTEPFTYTVQYARDSLFTKGAATIANIPSGKTDTIVSNLMPDSTYYFRARVNNAGGSSAWTKFKSLKTLADASGIHSATTLNLAVYPNPATEFVKIVLDADAKIAIFNLSGIKVKEISGTTGINTVGTATLPSGMYMVKSGSRVARFVKK